MHEKWLTNSRDAKKREQSRARRHVQLDLTLPRLYIKYKSDRRCVIIWLKGLYQFISIVCALKLFIVMMWLTWLRVKQQAR